MKSKKLFAILTLIAFTMTLVPALVFGAAVQEYGASASEVDLDKKTVKADGTATSTITVTFYAQGEIKEVLSAASPVADFYIKSSRDAEVVKMVQGAQSVTLSPSVENIRAVSGASVDANGEIEFKVTSYLSGKANFSFWKDPDCKNQQIGETVTINFSTVSSSVENVGIACDKVSVGAGESFKLTATVTDRIGNAFSGKEVTFYKKKDGGSFTSIGSVVTDSKGKAELKYSETKAGNYEFRAKCAGKTTAQADYANLVVDMGSPVKIEAVTESGKVFDVDSSTNKVKFIIKDYYGNKIDDPAKIEVEIDSAPKDSKYYDVDDVKIAASEIQFDLDDEEFWVTVDFDEVGEYKVKGIIVGTGIFAEVRVVAKEAGDVEKMILKFKKDNKKALIAGEDSNGDVDTLTLEAKCVDANGIEFDAENFKAYSSDVSLVKIDSDSINGEVTLAGPADEDKKGVATITVVDLDTAKTASIEVPVVGGPYALDVDYTVSGKTAKVTMQFVDKGGAVTAIRDATANSDQANEYELLLADDVVVSDKKLFNNNSGEATFALAVDEYGKYDVTVITEQGIVKNFAVVIGVPEDEKDVKGAKSVTMFIGSSGYVQDGVAMMTDVAPFIKDDRTFVAIRPIADAFGCEIGWNEVAQEVTLVRDDVIVTITIGSTDIEVVEDGVISTVVTDVPAFIVDGRTVLPFRAVGDAFGVTVNYDAATQSVSYIQ